MIVIKCKTCGSTNVIKQDDKYVCQDCGAEYSAMDAMSLISDDAEAQPIKPNKSQAKTEELYSLARQAREDNDWAAAETYYEALLQKDPNGWEAPFYLAFRKVDNTSNDACEQNCQNLSFAFEHVFTCAKHSCENEDALKAVAQEIQEKTEYLAKEITSRAYRDHPWLTTNEELSERVTAGFTMLSCLALAFDEFFKNGEMASEATDLRKKAVQYYAELAKKLNVGAYVLSSGAFDKAFGDTIEKIKAYEPSYVHPSLVSDTSNSTTASPTSTYSSSSSSSSSSSGCYIATAVYGSYDCPEVWTLRRFRDFTLAETWYGRAFIKTYYAISPTLVKWFGKTEWFRKMWRGPLDSFVNKLRKEGVKDTPYSDQ